MTFQTLYTYTVYTKYLSSIVLCAVADEPVCYCATARGPTRVLRQFYESALNDHENAFRVFMTFLIIDALRFRNTALDPTELE